VTNRGRQQWPFAASLRLSSMALLSVVLSTFVTGWPSVGLLVAAAILTTASVVHFVQALRQVRHGSPGEAFPSGEEGHSKDYA